MNGEEKEEEETADSNPVGVSDLPHVAADTAIARLIYNSGTRGQRRSTKIGTSAERGGFSSFSTNLPPSIEIHHQPERAPHEDHATLCDQPLRRRLLLKPDHRGGRQASRLCLTEQFPADLSISDTQPSLKEPQFHPETSLDHP